jgi:site-specific DNA-cytosine methylase
MTSNKKLRVLVACEYSGKVRDAFTALGHEAMSCDLLPTDSPGLHYQGDVLDVLDGWMPVQYAARYQTDMLSNLHYSEVHNVVLASNVLLARPVKRPHWDIMIAHPPCTHLAVSGAKWFKDKVQEQHDAIEFVKQLLNANIKHIALENPVSVLSSKIRKPEQIINPWQFGHGEKKRTCLWLKNLPLLSSTNVVEGRSNRMHMMPDTKDRWKKRSETYQGIADAMAKQYSEFVLLQDK